ncbi:MbnH family di-heme enzyme [Gaopeijia maritima]|uniref:MbnH family di-heme enzyme n=1 Tax=Gaopeijia maritima TaxID=3119007 RepID=UPI00324630A5
MAGDARRRLRLARVGPVALAAGLTLAGAGCGGDEMLGPDQVVVPTGPFDWRLPDGFPAPRVPEGEEMSAEKVDLGLHLFYDVRLSGNQTQSCASCHRQELAFTDGLPVAEGSTGQLHPRNSMSLTNAGYQPALNWANPNEVNLAHQALTPLFGEDPVELGLAGMEDQLLARLEADSTYQRLFAAAWPDRGTPVSVETITRSLAAFQRTLISGDSPVDRYRRGDRSALSESARRGQALFFSERLECFHCHGGLGFTGTFDFEGKSAPEIEFHNNGLYNIDGVGGYPPHNTGLHEFTERPEDMGRFKAPTLRNIDLTAPYMHDGSIATLDEVLDHYMAGGRAIVSGPFAGVGSDNPNKSGFVKPFSLTGEERTSVLDFLRALTDSSFITDPRFANPWPAGSPAHGSGS